MFRLTNQLQLLLLLRRLNRTNRSSFLKPVLKAKSKKPEVKLPDFLSEVALGFFASKMIIGVDEVGRGCLAGPVVAAAVVLCPERVKLTGFKETGQRPGGRRKGFLFEVRDSKLVPEEERGPLALAISEFVLAHAVKEASVDEIERLNILYASHLAMERAVTEVEEKMGRQAHAILVDGHIVPRAFLGRGHPLIKGDLKSVTIACASLLAKAYRDALMERMDALYPGYGFGQHKGYGTPFHKTQIRALGICELHRPSFRGVSEFESGMVEPDLFDFSEPEDQNESE